MKLTYSVEYSCLIQKLRPHPRHKEIYDAQAYPELIESIREIGILDPLVIEGYEVVIGCRRLDAAKRLNLKMVPVRVIQTQSNGASRISDGRERYGFGEPAWAYDGDLIMAMLDSNVHRPKTAEEKRREVGWRFMIDYHRKEKEPRVVGRRPDIVRLLELANDATQCADTNFVKKMPRWEKLTLPPRRTAKEISPSFF